MYDMSCDGCGRSFGSGSYNSRYCSSSCADSHADFMQRSRGYGSSSSNSDTSHTGSQPLSAEFIILVATGIYLWKFMKDSWNAMIEWREFEPVTQHILHIFHYIFYKPLHFSTVIHSFFTDYEVKHGLLIFFIKWFVIFTYLFFLTCIYASIIIKLHDRKLNWVWVLFMLSPIITHLIWKYIIL